MEKGVEVICFEVMTGPFGGWGGRDEKRREEKRREEQRREDESI